jgi:nitrile hydratase beta subunit-like protein
VAELGYSGMDGSHMVALENTSKRHNVAEFLLSVAGTRVAAGLVQVAALSLARSQRSTRCAQGLWADAPCRHRNLRVGFDRRDPLFGGPDATCRHRGLGPGEVGRTRCPRLDDRRRPAKIAIGRAMNGAHDMGGMHGFGPVIPEPNEPVFHAEWEKRAFALTLATNISARWNNFRRGHRTCAGDFGQRP